MHSARASKAGNRPRGVFIRAALGLFILVSSIQTLPAHAADIGCGRDTDNSGSVDIFCGSRVTRIGSPCDKDNDGYLAKRCGGNDYYDTDARRFPGIYIEDSANSSNVRYLKTDGTLGTSGAKTSCSSYADYSCTSCRWIDPTSGNNANNGQARNTAWLNFLNFVTYYIPGDRPAGYEAPSGTNPCYIWMTGSITDITYTYNSATTAFYWRALGASVAPRMFVEPGATVTWNYSTSGDDLYRINIEDTDNGILEGFDLSGGRSHGIFVAGDSDNWEVRKNKIHGSRKATDNHGGITSNGGANHRFHHNSIYDLLRDSGFANGETGIMIFSGNNLRIDHNDIRNTNDKSAATGMQGIFVKRAYFNDAMEIDNNYIDRAKGYALASAGGLFNIHHNLVVNSDVAARFGDFSNENHAEDSKMFNNTFILSSSGIDWRVLKDDNMAIASPAADVCSADHAVGNFVYRNNIQTDDVSGAYANITRPIFLSIEAPDSITTELSNAFDSVANVFHNANGLTPSFGRFERNNAGNTTCSGVQPWGNTGASRSLAQFQSDGNDVGSVIADPSCSAVTGVCTAAEARGKGAIPYY